MGRIQGMGGVPSPAAKTLYLHEQVLACVEAPTFPLDLSFEQLAQLRAAGIERGDVLTVVDAAQDYFAVQVISFDEDLCVRISTRNEVDTGRPPILLVQGLCEDAVMDTIVRQGTEIGVAGFLPFTSEFSVRMDAVRCEQAKERLTQLARYSSFQAGLYSAPLMMPVMPIQRACDYLADCDAVVLCWEGETQRTMAQAAAQIDAWGLDASATVALVVGPRGGITPSELALLGSSNKRLLTVSLGPSILRVETASLVAPALLINALGGLQ